jgi:hypothetical protein
MGAPVRSGATLAPLPVYVSRATEVNRVKDASAAPATIGPSTGGLSARAGRGAPCAAVF